MGSRRGPANWKIVTMSEPKSQQDPSMEEILTSIRRIISADGRDDEGNAEADGEEEILELTEEAPDEFRHSVEPDKLTESGPPAAVAAEPESGSDPEPGSRDAEAPELKDPPFRGRVAELDESLISKGSARASERSLAALAAAVGRQRHSPALGMSERTLEDLVKEVMRPMIKEWLDSNLPGLVERLVEREIDRLSRRAEGDR